VDLKATKTARATASDRDTEEVYMQTTSIEFWRRTTSAMNDGVRRLAAEVESRHRRVSIIGNVFVRTAPCVYVVVCTTNRNIGEAHLPQHLLITHERGTEKPLVLRYFSSS
jgi:hypothetical protein